MKTRERAIMDYTRRMAEIGVVHTDTLTALTQELLDYLQAGNHRSALERQVAEQQWRQAVIDAYHYWNERWIKAQTQLDADLATDPVIES